MLLVFLFSCRVPKNVQEDKPFVFRTDIKLVGKYSNEDRQDLLVRLNNQLDDSLQAKTVTAFSWPWKKPKTWIYQKLDAPPVFDSLNVSKSIVFMNALLVSNGYYAPQVKDSIRIDTVRGDKRKSEHRAIVKFTVTPGKQVVFDSVGFAIETPALQEIAQRVKSQSYLKKESLIPKPFCRLKSGGWWTVSGTMAISGFHGKTCT